MLGIVLNVLMFTIVIMPVVNIILLILWIISIVNAINGKKKDIPLIGQLAKKYLKF